MEVHIKIIADYPLYLLADESNNDSPVCLANVMPCYHKNADDKINDIFLTYHIKTN